MIPQPPQYHWATESTARHPSRRVKYHKRRGDAKNAVTAEMSSVGYRNFVNQQNQEDIAHEDAPTPAITIALYKYDDEHKQWNKVYEVPPGATILSVRKDLKDIQ